MDTKFKVGDIVVDREGRIGEVGSIFNFKTWRSFSKTSLVKCPAVIFDDKPDTYTREVFANDSDLILIDHFENECSFKVSKALSPEDYQKKVLGGGFS